VRYEWVLSNHVFLKPLSPIHGPVYRPSSGGSISADTGAAMRKINIIRVAAANDFIKLIAELKTIVSDKTTPPLNREGE
jgi:hypothetical protein